MYNNNDNIINEHRKINNDKFEAQFPKIRNKIIILILKDCFKLYKTFINL